MIIKKIINSFIMHNNEKIVNLFIMHDDKKIMR